MGISTTTEVIDMRLIETFFALVGVSVTVMVTTFYIGYITYCPPCGNVLAVFTEHCK
jgi:phosphatidylglycerophosphatase A